MQLIGGKFNCWYFTYMYIYIYIYIYIYALALKIDIAVCMPINHNKESKLSNKSCNHDALHDYFLV